MNHISFTQLSMYLRCGEQYRRRYIEGEKIPPGIALIEGISIHKGAEEQNRFKLATHEDRPKKEVLEIVSSAFDDNLKSGVWLTTEEKQRKSQVLGEAKDETIGLAGLYCDEVAPPIIPDKIELPFNIPLDSIALDLVGRVDLVDSQGTLRDLKTASRKKPQNEIDLTDQLTIYALGYEYLFGNPPPHIALDVLVKTKQPKYQEAQTSRTHDDIDIFFRRMQAILEGIKKGIFIPADPTHWCCSERFCGYWWTCPYARRR